MKKKPIKKTKKPQEKKTQAINSSFEDLVQALRAFQFVCAKNDSALRCVTFRVRDDNTTRTRITYQGRKSKPTV